MFAPPGGLDRLAQAYEEAVQALPDRFSETNAELLRPDTELALVVVLAVWAGFQVHALGWLNASIAEFKSAAQLGAEGKALDASVSKAVEAPNPTRLKEAAFELYRSLEGLGAAKVKALIGTSEFSSLRAGLKDYRGQLLTGQLWSDKAGGVRQESAPPGTIPNPGRVLWWVLGGTAATIVTLVVVTKAPKRRM